MLFGCSGGDTPAQGPPDYSLAVSPSTLNLQAGTSDSVAVFVTASNGFSSPVTLEVTGLPPGVTVSPANLQVKPETPQRLTFSSAASVVPSTAFVTVLGSSGTHTHSVQFTLATEAQPAANTSGNTKAPTPPKP